MKKVSEEDLISLILELQRVITMVQFSIPKSPMYDKTFAICNQVQKSSFKVIERYMAGLVMEKRQLKLDSMIIQERLDKLNHVINISMIELPKPRNCPFCNKPIIGKITKVYCNENHRRKYLQKTNHDIKRITEGIN